MKLTPRRTGFFSTSDQAQIYFETYGDHGSVLVLTYGIACLINHWHHQIEELSKDHQILVYDLRGHHKSGRGKSTITVDLLAQDALDLFHFVFPHEKSAHFVGHSFGAPISLRCASLSPECVKSSIYINGFYKNPFEKFLSTENGLKIFKALQTFELSAPSLSKFLWKQAVETFLFHYISSVTGGFNMERTPYKDIEIYSRGLGALNLTYLLESFLALVEFDGTAYLKSTANPVLIIFGDRDGIVPLSQNKQLADSLSQSKLLELREGSHCTQLDLPNKVNQSIRDWVENGHI